MKRIRETVGKDSVQSEPYSQMEAKERNAVIRLNGKLAGAKTDHMLFVLLKRCTP